jgi:hypothetical protein
MGVAVFREINVTKQIAGAPKRRWYQSDYFDLYVWYIKHDERKDASANREFVGFQLCYDIRRNQRALAWKKDQGFTHTRVSGSGDTMSDRGASASLMMDGGEFDHAAVLDKFMAVAPSLPSVVRRLVMGKLVDYATTTIERPLPKSETFGSYTDVPASGAKAAAVAANMAREASTIAQAVTMFRDDEGPSIDMSKTGKLQTLLASLETMPPPAPQAPMMEELVVSGVPAAVMEADDKVVIIDAAPPMPKRDPLALTGKFATIKEDIRTFGKN